MPDAHTISCRVAGASDVPHIMKVIEQAREALRAEGVAQWQDGFPLARDIEADVRDRIGYVFTDSEGICAFVCLSFEEEEPYRVPVSGAFSESAGAYATVHRAAVCERARGQGLSHALFAVCEQTCRRRGIAYLRVDTHEKNARMRHIIAREGFTQVATVRLGSGALRLAYEKKLS